MIEERIELMMRVFNFAMEAHFHHAKKEEKRWRKSLPSTPYFVHPLWCATAIAQENTLPEDVRIRGAMALALHDVLEDTTVGLPPGLPADVAALVEDLTVQKTPEETTTAIELKHLETLSDEACLLKLFDKTSNLLPGPQDWMGDQWPTYLVLLGEILDRVRPHHPDLVIVRLAQDILDRG